MNARHAHDVLVQDLQASIKAADVSRAKKAIDIATSKQAAAEAKGNLQDTTSTKAADEAYLSDLQATCSSKAEDFEGRQSLRAEEIQALERAIEILSSSAVSGAAA